MSCQSTTDPHKVGLEWFRGKVEASHGCFKHQWHPVTKSLLRSWMTGWPLPGQVGSTGIHWDLSSKAQQVAADHVVPRPTAAAWLGSPGGDQWTQWEASRDPWWTMAEPWQSHGSHVPWKAIRIRAWRKVCLNFRIFSAIDIISSYGMISMMCMWYMQILTDSVRSLKCQVPRAGVKSLPCTGCKTLTLQGGCKAQLIFGHEPWLWDVTQFTHVSSTK